MKIAGARALITGASRGIGADLAGGLRSAGAEIALVARDSEELHAKASELGALAYPTDLTDCVAVGGLLERVEADGPIDILVNNAADEKIGGFDTMDADALDFMLKLNVYAVAELTRQGVPRMIGRGRGHIVNVSSFAGVICPPSLATYAATKAFITHHTVNLAEEFRDSPVNFTKVEIGEVADTGLGDKGRTDPTFSVMLDRFYALHLSRQITPQEITRKVLEAIELERESVRLPRRMAFNSYLVDAPRRLSCLVTRDIRRKQRSLA